MKIDPGLAVALAIALFFLFLVFKGIRIVPQAQVMMIERLGRFHKVAHSGLNFIFPLSREYAPFVSLALCALPLILFSVTKFGGFLFHARGQRRRVAEIIERHDRDRLMVSGQR